MSGQRKTTFNGIEVDDDTMPLLLDLAKEAGCPPRVLISSIVRDVLHDDARHHTEAERTKLN